MNTEHTQQIKRAKYIKNMLWFNTERMITGLWIVILLVLLSFGMQSCSSTSTVYAPNYEWLKEKQSNPSYNKHIQWSCPNFKN